jgi:hypothetical protein
LSWSSHEDDERSIINFYSVLLKCALVTMVWIVRGYMVFNGYIFAMISCMHACI